MSHNNSIDIKMVILILILCASDDRYLSASDRVDPRSLIVMIKFKDTTGMDRNGAGIIISQDKERTLIVTAGHNLRDELGNLHGDFRVYFHSAPDRKVSAKPISDIISTYDFGLLSVSTNNTPDSVKSSLSQGAVAADVTLSSTQKVYVVGFGGGLPWNHNVVPVPIHKASVANLVIDTNSQLPGQSGGGVFTQDWTLIGMIYQTDGVTANALPLSVILDEVRNSNFAVSLKEDPYATQKDARRKLADRNIEWNSASVAGALTAVETEVLDLFSKAKLEPGMLAESLSSTSSYGTTVAYEFFKRSKNNKEAVRWLRGALADGLNPNLVIKGDYYKQEGMLNVAVRAGNAAVVKELILAGASPHSYQDLWFTTYPITRFLLPSYYIYDHEEFNDGEKRELLLLYSDYGVVVPDINEVNKNTYQTDALNDLLTKAKSETGFEVQPSPDLCTRPRTKICEYSTKQTGHDWCAFVKEMPKRIYVDQGGAAYHFYNVKLIGLIYADSKKGYYLGMENTGFFKGPVLVEASANGRYWKLYMYMSPAAGMGHCRKTANGMTPDYCWRKISMKLEKAENKMLVENWYPYKVSMSCGS